MRRVELGPAKGTCRRNLNLGNFCGLSGGLYGILRCKEWIPPIQFSEGENATVSSLHWPSEHLHGESRLSTKSNATNDSQSQQFNLPSCREKRNDIHDAARTMLHEPTKCGGHD